MRLGKVHGRSLLQVTGPSVSAGASAAVKRWAVDNAVTAVKTEAPQHAHASSMPEEQKRDDYTDADYKHQNDSKKDHAMGRVRS